MTRRGLLALLAVCSAVLMGCPTWVCGPDTCADGCCQADGTCAVGWTTDRCGKDGNACATCNAGDECTLGVCTAKCGPSNCGGGCCDSTGKCQTWANQTSNMCGNKGVACGVCSGASYACASGVCCAPKNAVCIPNANNCCGGSTCVPTSASSGFCQ